jgi:hypothetical protein
MINWLLHHLLHVASITVSTYYHKIRGYFNINYSHRNLTYWTGFICKLSLDENVAEYADPVFCWLVHIIKIDAEYFSNTLMTINKTWWCHKPSQCIDIHCIRIATQIYISRTICTYTEWIMMNNIMTLRIMGTFSINPLTIGPLMSYIHIYIYIHTHTHIYIYIYIYIWARILLGILLLELCILLIYVWKTNKCNN